MNKDEIINVELYDFRPNQSQLIPPIIEKKRTKHSSSKSKSKKANKINFIRSKYSESAESNTSIWMNQELGRVGSNTSEQMKNELENLDKQLSDPHQCKLRKSSNTREKLELIRIKTHSTGKLSPIYIYIYT